MLSSWNTLSTLFDCFKLKTNGLIIQKAWKRVLDLVKVKLPRLLAVCSGDDHFGKCGMR